MQSHVLVSVINTCQTPDTPSIKKCEHYRVMNTLTNPINYTICYYKLIIAQIKCTFFYTWIYNSSKTKTD